MNLADRIAQNYFVIKLTNEISGGFMCGVSEFANFIKVNPTRDLKFTVQR